MYLVFQKAITNAIEYTIRAIPLTSRVQPLFATGSVPADHHRVQCIGQLLGNRKSRSQFHEGSTRWILPSSRIPRRGITSIFRERAQSSLSGIIHRPAAWIMKRKTCLPWPKFNLRDSRQSEVALSSDKFEISRSEVGHVSRHPATSTTTRRTVYYSQILFFNPV
jgi:hypothetical protein